MNHTDLDILNGILTQFAALCRHPHPSYGEGPLADYVEGLLIQRGLSPVRDEWNNIMADLPPTPGREDAPLTVLQGHLDMVCAVKQGSGYEPATSPVIPVVEGGWLRSDGNSSLGADNCLGNAVVLWLTEQNIPHGPVRLLFTTAEEVGLQGAKRVAPAWLDEASYLINTDGFVLGKAVVSSAGGLRETFRRPLELVPRTKTAVFSLELAGFPGGHSGYDIHRGRINPIRLAAQWLRGLDEEYELLSLSGGHAENAIPMDCTVLLAVEEADVPVLNKAAEELVQQAQGESGGRVVLKRREHGADHVWSKAVRNDVLTMLTDVFAGVHAWRDRETEQVSASSNLGWVRTEERQVSLSCFIRASQQEDEDVLARQHGNTARQTGFEMSIDAYPGWPERPGNRLTETMVKVWRDVTGKDMDVAGVHVGLEPSVLGAKNPDMLMVNTGPDIFDPHSLDERAPLDGLADYARLLAGTLDKLSR